MPPFQREAKCKAIDMKIIFHSHANRTCFYKKGFLSLVWKVRVFGTRKWHISIFPARNGELNGVSRAKDRVSRV